MRRLLLLVCWLALSLVLMAQNGTQTASVPDTVSLLELRQLPPGTLASFSGFVTRSWGQFTRLEDGTAGITIRQPSGAFADSVDSGAIREGALLFVTARLSSINQLLLVDYSGPENNDLAAFEIKSYFPGMMAPADIPASAVNFSGELYESELVRIHNLQLLPAPDTLFSPSSIYRAYLNGDPDEVWVDIEIGTSADNEVAGTRKPAGPFTLYGVITQNHPSDPSAGYRVFPVYPFDILPETPPEPDVRPVTFRVNMTAAMMAGKFAPARDSVWVRGSFNDFSLRDRLIDTENDGIYEKTFEIEGPPGMMHQYKFYVSSPDIGWEGPVGPGGEYGNRVIMLGPPGYAMELPPVMFNNAVVQPDPLRKVTFVVNMEIPYVEQLFRPSANDRVVVNGDFNAWGMDPERRFELESIPGTNLMKAEVPVYGPEGMYLHYKFRIESGDGRQVRNDGWEELWMEMPVQGPMYNRVLQLGPPGVDTLLDAVRFSNLEQARGYLSITRLPVNGDILEPGAPARLSIVANRFTDLYGMGMRIRADYPLQITGVELQDDPWIGQPNLGRNGLQFVQFGPDSSWVDISLTQVNGAPTGFNNWYFAIVTVATPETLDYRNRYFVQLNDVLAVDHTGAQLRNFYMDHGFQFRSLGPEVWPGDTDISGHVNAGDLLPIGQFYGKMGPMRGNGFDISWRGVEAVPWMEFGATHADATGDGIVNQNDVLPVGVNYNRYRINDTLRATKALPVLATATLPPVRAGDRVLISVTPDLRNVPEVRMLGAALSLRVPPALKMNAYSEPDWLTHNQLLRFHHNDPAAGLTAVAVSRRAEDGAVTPAGAVLQVEYTVTADLAGGAVQLTDLMLSGTAALHRNLPAGLTVTILPSTPAVPERVLAFALAQNEPNPFNPSTAIRYQLAQPAHTVLTVYNQIGQNVATLVNGTQPAGEHTVRFDASGLASGLYFYKLESGGHTSIRKMMLIK